MKNWFSGTFLSKLFVAINAQKIRFSVKDFLSKCNQIHSFLWISSQLLKKSLKARECKFENLPISLPSYENPNFYKHPETIEFVKN